jgi:hypothetical protein
MYADVQARPSANRTRSVAASSPTGSKASIAEEILAETAACQCTIVKNNPAVTEAGPKMAEYRRFLGRRSRSCDLWGTKKLAFQVYPLLTIEVVHVVRKVDCGQL